MKSHVNTLLDFLSIQQISLEKRSDYLILHQPDIQFFFFFTKM